MKHHHVTRLQEGQCTIEQGFVFNDILTNLERVADHCSNIAIDMIELYRGSFDTHGYLEDMRHQPSENFENYLNAYKEKYSIAHS
jgi:phosphate:Na+ symporter